MIINQANAVAVAAIFDALADERYTMRTPAAIVKHAANPDVTEAVVMELTAQMGMPLRRRIRDDAVLIERPVSAAEAIAIRDQALNIAAGNSDESFEVDYMPEPLPENDVMGDIETGLGGGHADDEDTSFT